jgi:hypothetical protein
MGRLGSYPQGSAAGCPQVGALKAKFCAIWMNFIVLLN